MKNLNIKMALFALPVIFALTSCGGGGASSSSGNALIPQPVIQTNTKSSPVSTPAEPVKAAPALDIGDQTKGSQEAAIFAAINKVRAEGRTCGNKFYPAAPAVTWNGYLARAARAHANDMATRGYFSHNSPEGSTMRDRVPAAGYTGWSELGENLAAGLGLSNVMEGWLSSASHCATMMDPALKEVGVGFVERTGSPFKTYWVQNFGTR